MIDEEFTNNERRCVDDLGRIVIPKQIRDYLQIKPGDELYIRYADGAIIITDATSKASAKTDYKAKYDALLLKYANAKAAAANLCADVEWLKSALGGIL